MRFRQVLLPLLVAILSTNASPIPAPVPAPAPVPPNIPSGSTARSQLSALRVAPVGSQTGYSRDLFPHWSAQSGACNTREVVLKRDGTNVVQDSSCAAVSGRWYSPFDGATWTEAADVDIDHMVPLSNAWKSGASSWSTDRREQFANDLDIPQLIAVTDNVNQEKGDQGPESWRPPLTSYWCTYAAMWVNVKYNYDLSVNSAEKNSLSSMLSGC